MSLVVDASVALGRRLKSERTPYANEILEHVLTEGAIVPALWPSETANGLLPAKRRGRITPAEIAQAAGLPRSLRIEVVSPEANAAIERLLEVGDQFGLTAHDAAYLSLAMQEGRPLATNDEALKAAAAKAEVALFAGARS